MNSATACIHIGVDPGAHGAIAALLTDSATGATSVLVVQKIEGMSRQDWVAFMRGLAARSHRIDAFVEQAGSRPGEGVSSANEFGRQLERPLMSLSAAGIPFTEVSPRKWQTIVGVTYTSPAKPAPVDDDKENKARMRRYFYERKVALKAAVRERGQQLYPGVKLTNETADSLLIAEACRRATY